MKRIVGAVIALAFVMGSALSVSAASAITGICTKIQQSTFTDTTLNHDPGMRYFDPIVFPGIYGYFASDDAPYNQGIHGPAHWHTFFGNRSLNPYGIQDGFASTTCTGGFRGNFWTPSLIGYNADVPNGGRLDPVSITYTMGGQIVPPSGTGFIQRTALWDCGPGTAQTDVPLVCPNRKTPQATLVFARTTETGVAMPKLSVRVVFQASYFGALPITSYSVGGVSIAVGTPGFPEFGPPLKEDEHSMHMDVLYP
jgi:hypothetical protein